MLSVIIPTFNDEKNLPLSVTSALECTNVSEVIVVDDNSTDNTAQLLKEISSNFCRVRFFKNKKNLGSGFSFIRGLSKAKNDYIIMLNSDDFFIPKGIDNLLSYTKSNDLEVCYGKMGIKKQTGVFRYSHPGYMKESYVDRRNELTQLLIYDMYLPSFGTIIKKNVLKVFYNKQYYSELLQEYGGYFKAHDYDLFINLAKQKKKFGFLNETVCVWCPKENSQSGETYYNTGEACFESAFLFNRYADDVKFNYNEIELIESRVISRLVQKGPHVLFPNKKILSHVDKFKKKIKKLKIEQKKTANF